ncbi:PhoX family phosphatase [Marinicauda algicola]|uniref:PhoX family phosphatase n=1 Tax=Marinicauda algicola TaxID=2029849 RepID=A0A4S2H2R8_9PROT|nr:PhoX family phosphatase [Marinicauda algicola]TGY89885.1 PhoX family phosphatase [Marinicauda algicola]
MTAHSIGELIDRRLTRRAALGLLGGAGLAAGLPAGGARALQDGVSSLAFTQLDHAIEPDHAVAPGYRAEVLIRWGDAMFPDAPVFDPWNQSAEAQARQFGTQNDFIAYFGEERRSDRGLLCVNNEFTFMTYQFPDFEPFGADEAALAHSARAAMEAVGVSIVHVARGADGRWRVEPGPATRRISATTPMRLSGPAAGDERMRTSASPDGLEARGTYGNCAGGQTPWNTYLTCEEGFFLFFSGEPDPAHRETIAYQGYDLPRPNAFPWWRHAEARFDLATEPREPNHFGWVVEIDPFDAEARPVKRTALGRFAHEAASVTLAPDGRVVVYSGDDRPFEHLYRFVSARAFDPANPESGRDILDEGTLSVARFGADGRLTWLPLVFGEGPLREGNGFASQADVLIETRRAAKLVGATPMDRPEDVEVRESDGSVWLMLTGNSLRATPDAANPRANNRYGHVLRMDPPRNGAGRPDPAADVFLWDVFIRCGDPAEDSHNALYHPALSQSGWMTNPDNAAFDPAGRLWIATDHGMDIGHCNGLWATDTHGPGARYLKHFYRCPAGAELCGPCFTPDGQTLFVAVQHPGISGEATITEPLSRWPDFREDMVPRSAVVAVTKADGGPIGS